MTPVDIWQSFDLSVHIGGDSTHEAFRQFLRRIESILIAPRRVAMFLPWFILGACIVALSMPAWDWLAEAFHRKKRDR